MSTIINTTCKKNQKKKKKLERAKIGENQNLQKENQIK